MSTSVIATIILLGVFLGLLILRVPVIYAVGAAALSTILYLGIDLMTMASIMIKTINTYSLLCIPLFILMGEVMSAGGISQRLIGLADALVGWMRGGLAMANCVASLFFGGISGSSAADTASLGPILIPMMTKQGYDKDFSTCVTMASSVEGILIPPSQNMVIFCLAAGATGVSVGKLFMAGYLPGVLLAVTLMIYSYIVSVKRKYPVGSAFSIKRLLHELANSIWGLLTVLIVVVGVLLGYFTATESAAAACVWAIIVGMFIYKELTPKALWKCLGNVIQTAGKIGIMMAVCGVFSWLLTYLKIPAQLANFLFSLTDSKLLIMLLLNVMLLIFGMFLDMASLLLILTPIVLPIATQLGISEIQLGIIMILNLGIGLVTPPVGTTLYVGSAITGIKIEKLAKSMIPFYIVMIIALLLVCWIPELSTLLPSLFYAK